MNQPSEMNTEMNSPTNTPTNTEENTATIPAAKPQPSYVKLAMRNMVRKRGTSIYHFALTTIGLLTVLVGLAYITH